MDEYDTLSDGMRIGKRGSQWYLLDGDDPVGEGYHHIEHRDGHYFGRRGGLTYLVDERGEPLSEGYHEITALGDGSFRGNRGATREIFEPE